MTERKLTLAQAAFERAAGQPLNWTRELTGLADGYLALHLCAAETADSEAVRDAIVMSIGLASYGEAMGWISEPTWRVLTRTALDLKRAALDRLACQGDPPSTNYESTFH